MSRLNRLLLPFCLAVPWWLSSCGGTVSVRYDYPACVLYSETADSTGLAELLAFPENHRLARRSLAASWRRLAAAAGTTVGKVRALRNAAGLAPDDPDTWLKLAQLTRWCGSAAETRKYLRAARASLLLAPIARRDELHLRILRQQAWFEHARGRWERGLALTDTALTLAPKERRTLLVRGLMLAGYGLSRDATYLATEIERQEFFRTDWRWIRAWTEFRRGRPTEARHLFSFRPNPLHRADCFSDMGTVSERLGFWHRAREEYENAKQSLPLPDLSFLVRHELPPPGKPADTTLQPVWLAFDRFYTVGSLVTYTALAGQRFEEAETIAAREFWAEAALDAATVCLRKRIGAPWALAWRGRVYAQLEMYDLAEADLSRALTDLERRGLEDAPTLAWLGRTKLMQKAFGSALSLLRRSVAIDSLRAATWSDLGYGLLMTQDIAAAHEVLDRALGLDPGLAVAWYNRGLLHFHARRWSEAVSDLSEAARLAPDNQDIASILQRALLMQERAPTDP